MRGRCAQLGWVSRADGAGSGIGAESCTAIRRAPDHRCRDDASSQWASGCREGRRLKTRCSRWRAACLPLTAAHHSASGPGANAVRNVMVFSGACCNAQIAAAPHRIAAAVKSLPIRNEALEKLHEGRRSVNGIAKSEDGLGWRPGWQSAFLRAPAGWSRPQRRPSRIRIGPVSSARCSIFRLAPDVGRAADPGGARAPGAAMRKCQRSWRAVSPRAAPIARGGCGSGRKFRRRRGSARRRRGSWPSSPGHSRSSTRNARASCEGIEPLCAANERGLGASRSTRCAPSSRNPCAGGQRNGPKDDYDNLGPDRGNGRTRHRLGHRGSIKDRQPFAAPIVCESPVLLEKRAFALARILMAALRESRSSPTRSCANFLEAEALLPPSRRCRVRIPATSGHSRIRWTALGARHSRTSSNRRGSRRPRDAAVSPLR